MTMDVPASMQSGDVVTLRLKLQRDQSVVDDFWANEEYKNIEGMEAFDDAGVWYDKAHIAEDLFAQTWKYDFVEFVDLSKGIDTNGMKPGSYSYAYAGRKANEIAFKQESGLEIRAYAEDGSRIYNAASVGVGKKVRLKAYTKEGEADVIFYCQTDGNDKVEISGNVITPVGRTLISAVLKTDVPELVSVESIAESIDVTNGDAAEKIRYALPAFTLLTVADGRRIKAEIDWTGALDAYDPAKKEASEYTVSGKVLLPEGFSNTGNLSLAVSTKLKISAAQAYTPSKSALSVPESVTVAKGTPMTAQELGLPTTLLFQSGDKNPKEAFLKIDWSYDAAAKQMVGVVAHNGYVSDQTYRVDVTQTEGGITTPAYFGIVYTDAAGAGTNVIYPREAAKYTGNLSVTFPEGQKSREITIVIPRGFKDVKVFDADLYESVDSTEAIRQDDGSYRIVIKVNDELEEGRTLTVGFNFTPLYNEREYESGLFHYLQNDLGMNFADGSKIPIKVEYQAEQSGTVGKIYLPLQDADRLTLTHAENYMLCGAPDENVIEQYEKEAHTIVIPRFYGYSAKAPYFVSAREIIPMPDVTESPESFITDYERGNKIRYVQLNTSDYYKTRKVKVSLKSGMPGGEYEAAKSIFVGTDAWGNTLTYDTGASVKIKINNAGETIRGSFDPNMEESAPLQNTNLIYPAGMGSPRPGRMGYASFHTDDGAILCTDAKLILELPDGTFPAYMYCEFYNQYSIPPATVTFRYSDWEEESIPIDQFALEPNYGSVDLKSAESKFKTENKRVTALIVTWDQVEISGKNGYTSIEPMFVLEAYESFANGSYVPHGMLFDYDNQVTDCPFARGKITLQLGSQTFTGDCGGYLICAGGGNVDDFYFSTDQGGNTVVHNYTQCLNHTSGQPMISFYGALWISKESYAADCLRNLRVTMDVVDIFDIKSLQLDKDFEGADNGKVTFYYSDNSTQEMALTEIPAAGIKTADGKRVEKIELFWEDTSFLEELEDHMKFHLGGDVNYVLYKEKYGKNDWGGVLVNGIVEADDMKAVPGKMNGMIQTTYNELTTICVDHQTASVVDYDNRKMKVVSVVSELEQKDGAYIKWYLRRTRESSPGTDPKGKDVVHLKRLTFKLDTPDPKAGDFVIGDDIYLNLQGFSYDADGDGVAETVLQDKGKLYPSEVKKLADRTYQISFDEFYYVGYSTSVVVRIHPTLHTKDDIKVRLYATSVSAYEEQPLRHPSVQDMMTITYSVRTTTNYYNTTVDVLTAYTEKLEGYGNTQMNSDAAESCYMVGKGESFDYTTHIFNNEFMWMDDLELIIDVPAKDAKLVTDKGSYEQGWSARLEKLTVPADAEKNYKMYYTTDKKTWTEFDGTKEAIPAGTDPVAFKITATKAVNGDEISMSLSQTAISTADAYMSTYYQYKDCNTHASKDGYTRIVKYSGVKNVYLDVPTTPLDLGEAKTGESVKDIAKRIKLSSQGLDEVKDVKISIVTKTDADSPGDFTVKSKRLDKGVIPSIPSGEDELVYIGVKDGLSEGSYTAAVKIEWTDDNGSHTEEIPVSFLVTKTTSPAAKYHVSYDANLPAGESLTAGAAPTDTAVYQTGDTVSLKGDGGMKLDGYRFVGWAKEASAAEKDVITSLTLASADVTLYAVWKKEEPVKPTVSDNTVSNNDPKPSVSGNETTGPQEPDDKKPNDLPKDESKIDPNKLEKRKDLSILLVRGKAKTTTSVTLTWLKEKKADGYEVYWSYCDGKNNYKKLATIKKNKKRTYTHKKLKKTREYKYFVASYRMVSGRKVYISKSPNVHVAMSFDKRTNVKKIKTNKSKVTLSVKNKKYKKTFTIKAKMTLENKKKKALQHVRVLRYYTSDKSVAKVSSKGVITAKGKGKCTIYVIANNGAYKKIKVTVK